MSRLSRATSLLLSVLLGIALLFAEYWQLHAHDQKQQHARLQQWSVQGASLVLSRLQSALDESTLLAEQLSALPDSGPFPSLPPSLRGVARDDGLIAGVGVLQRVDASRRAAFENHITTPIHALQGSRLTNSPPLPLYYPVASYLPNDGNALPLGLDMGGIGDAKPRIEQALRGDAAVLMVNQPYRHGPIRLDIVTRLNRGDALLLVNLRPEKLLQPAGSLPDGNPLRHMRLLVWSKEQMDAPLLDSQPGQALPSEPPLFTSSQRIGESALLFGSYPLQEPPLLSLTSIRALALSTILLLLLLGIHLRQQRINLRLRNRLQQQHQQLEQNNQTLRGQVREREQSEQALAQSEARQRAILHASSDAIILIRQDGRIAQANPAAARLVGQPAESLDNLPVGALLAELYSADPRYDFEQHAKARAGQPFEAQLLRSDDQRLPVELSLSEVTLPDDKLYVMVCRDISLRKEQEEALIQLKNSLAEQVEVQSRQMAALLDASPLAMAYIVDRKLRQVNKAFLELFSKTEEQAIGECTIGYFESPESWERTGKALYSLLNDGKVVQTEVKLRTGGGQLFWCRLHGKAVNPSVPKLGTIWVYQDTSAQRALEETLRQAKILAEETSHAKTEFLANMSHELRTPLHAILGFAEMGQLRSRNLGDDKLEQYFTRINNSGSRLLTLLNDLLDMAKMEVGRMEYNIGRGSLTQCLREACDEMTPLAARNQIRIYLHSTPEQLTADIDAFRLGQVIRNLLSNAIKFSPPGADIRVVASLIAQPEGDQIAVSVEDSGPGIPEKELEAIFDKFIQSSSTKTGAGGTGLGLAICREIVLAHHGRIAAANLPDGGAAFTFTIPQRHGRGAEGASDASQTIAR